MFQTMTNAFIDEFDFLKSKKVLLTALLCVAELLIGLPCITKGGIYFLQIMDWYSSTFSLMIISFTECVVISWVYGLERFYKDIELMLGFRPCLWWKIMWGFVTPFMILFVFLFSILIHSPVTYGDHYSYPGWAIGIGWIFALCSLIPMPVIACRRMMEVKGSLWQRFRDTSHPSSEWGPSLEENRQKWLQTLTGRDQYVMRKVLQARPLTEPIHEKPGLELFTNV